MPVICENKPGEPGVWYLRYLYAETPVVRIVELDGGGCAVTFLRGAQPPGPYYASNMKQAWKHAGRWMASREEWLHGPRNKYGGHPSSWGMGMPEK